MRCDSHGRGKQQLQARLLKAFATTSAVELAIYNEKLRFVAVNNAAAAIPRIPAEDFVGCTMRDIVGDAAAEPVARLWRAMDAGQTPPVEISARLPMRSDTGYWIQKIFPLEGRSRRVTGVVSLAIEVTSYRNLEEYLRKLGPPQTGVAEHKRLVWELHQCVDQYHAALMVNLDALSVQARDPERIPELLSQSTNSLQERMAALANLLFQLFPANVAPAPRI